MGLEEYIRFRKSIGQCPVVPWNIESEELHRIEEEIKKYAEEIKRNEYIAAIERLKESYLVLLENMKGYNWGNAYSLFSIALFKRASLIEVYPLGESDCNLKKTIRGRNWSEYEKSPVPSELRWNITLETRAIKELEEIGTKFENKHERNGIPEPLRGATEDDLRRYAFWTEANCIAGYRKTVSLDTSFPFIHQVHRGYPIRVTK